MSDTRTKKIQLRVSEAEKAVITQKADAASLDVSSFIRAAALSEDRVIFLKEGATIAKELCEVVCTVQKAESSGNLSSADIQALLKMLDKIFTILNTVSEKLTDISNIGGDNE